MKRDKKENAVFARNLRYYVELSGKEQKDICFDLDIAEPSFSGYINGQNFPRLKTAQAIADYFGVRLADLVTDDEKNRGEEKRKLHEKLWADALGDVEFSDDEMADLIDYAKFLIGKRKA